MIMILSIIFDCHRISIRKSTGLKNSFLTVVEDRSFSEVDRELGVGGIGFYACATIKERCCPS